MKTRIIYPERLWTNKTFHKMDTTSKLFCLYLLSNRFIELTRIYKCPDLAIMFDLDIKEEKLGSIKKLVEQTGLFFFLDEWVYVNNDFSYVDYEGRDRVMEAKEKELSRIPEEVINHFEEVIKGLISGYKPPINTKSINPKSETLNPTVEEVKLFLEKFNAVYETKYISGKSFENNFKTWRKEYSLEQILEAIEKSKLSDFWHDKLTPEKLLRTNADRIGEFLNIKVAKLPSYGDIDGDEYIDEELNKFKVLKGQRIYANTAQFRSN